MIAAFTLKNPAATTFCQVSAYAGDVAFIHLTIHFTAFVRTGLIPILCFPHSFTSYETMIIWSPYVKNYFQSSSGRAPYFTILLLLGLDFKANKAQIAVPEKTMPIKKNGKYQNSKDLSLAEKLLKISLMYMPRQKTDMNRDNKKANIRITFLSIIRYILICLVG